MLILYKYDHCICIYMYIYMKYNLFNITNKYLLCIFLVGVLLLLFLLKVYFTSVEGLNGPFGGPGKVDAKLMEENARLMYPQFSSQFEPIFDSANADYSENDRNQQEFQNSPEYYTADDSNKLLEARKNKDTITEKRLTEKWDNSRTKNGKFSDRMLQIYKITADKLNQIVGDTTPIDIVNRGLSKNDFYSPYTAGEYTKMEEKRREVIQKIGKMAEIYVKGDELNTELYDTDLTNAQKEISSEQASVDLYKIQLKDNYNPLQVLNIRNQLSQANTRLTNAKKKVSDLEDFKQEFEIYKKDLKDFYTRAQTIIIEHIIADQKAAIAAKEAEAQAQAPAPAPVSSTNWIQNAAPNYPNYKYKGCWIHNNDASYHILSGMGTNNIPNMNACVSKISEKGFHSAAYDGKSLCLGGGAEYSIKNNTKVNCDTTYSKGKSWLVYSKY